METTIVPGKRSTKSKPTRKSAAPHGSKPARKASAAPSVKQAPGILTDEQLEILEFFGRTSPYLRGAPGRATLQLPKMLHPNLRREALAAIEEARKTGSARKLCVPFLLGSERRTVGIRVTRHKDRTSGDFRYEILFDETAPRGHAAAKASRGTKGGRRGVPGAARRTQEGARRAESRNLLLAGAEEEHRTTLEELKAANEELQEAAAELEVKNAELEASRAELEQTAEELRTALEESEQRERRLRESEGRVRALLETAAQGIVAADPSGRITLINAAAEAMFGYRRGEILGQPVEMLVARRLLDVFRRRRREFFARPRSRLMGQGHSLLARRKDGTTFPVEIGLSRIEPEGETAAVAFISDITERKRAEAELRLQAAITANMNEGIAMVRARDAVIVYANQRYHELFGYAPGELEGKPVTVLNAGSRAEAEATARKIIAVLHREGEWRGEIRNVRKDGSVFWSSTNVTTLEHEEYGAVWLGVLRDVTDRKQAETELREEHAFNAALLDSMRTLVVVLDREGRIVRFNKTCQEVTGYSFDEVRDRRIWDFLLVPEEIKSVKQVFRRLHAGRFPNQFENSWITKAGARRLIGWSNTALADPDGTVKFVIGTGLDITEQRRMEQALRQSHNELRQLTARLTSMQEEEYKHLSRELHDVFSQKLAMLGIEVTEMERKLSAAGVDAGEGLERIGEQISSLATEIHGISRRLHPAILDDLGLAAALKNECLAFSREHGIEVEFHSEGVPRMLPQDIALCLYRVSQETLTNIHKHAETGKALATLAGEPEAVVLSIEDFGKGFRPEEVRGTGGLGLVSMAERVRLVGGTLTVESNPGDGTTIQVRVPLKRPGRRQAKR